MIKNPSYAQLFYPVDGGYEQLRYGFMGTNNGTLVVSLQNAGMAPLHYITQRAPFQDGLTPLDFRWDGRTITIEGFQAFMDAQGFDDYRYDLVDALRPSRSFLITEEEPRPMYLRWWNAGGRIQRGHDLELTAGSDIVTSLTARFVHWGLDVGETITISGTAADDGTYTVVDVPNDYSVHLSSVMTNTETGITWSYRRGNAYRDLFLLCEEGPQFDQPTGFGPGSVDVMSFVAHDPFWYGREQEQAWTLPDDFDALVFDDVNQDAWFGASPGTGSWLFADNYVGEEIEVVYWGHEVAFPVIEIVGPAEEPVISNDVVGVTISVGYDIPAGQTLFIDTLNSTAFDSTGVDRWSFLTGDVALFGIYPAPQAPNRINTITLNFAGGAAGQSAGSIRWRNKYASY